MPEWGSFLFMVEFSLKRAGAGLLLMILFTGASCQNLNRASADTVSGDYDTRPIICFGDSITSGFNINGDGKDNRSRAYPAVLQRLVNVPVINAGIAGDSTREALYRLNRDVLSLNPQAVIVFLGINDVLQNFEFWFTEYNLVNIISNLVAHNRKIYIVRFLPDGVLHRYMALQGKSPEERVVIIGQFNDLYEYCVHTFGVEIIENLWGGLYGVYTPDSLHPNAAGHEIMGERIFNSMQPYLTYRNLVKQEL